MKSKGYLPVAQEIRQAFIEWVKELPVIKRGLGNDPGQEHQMEDIGDLISKPRRPNDESRNDSSQRK